MVGITKDNLKHMKSFRLLLLKRLLLSATIFSISIATLALFDLFPLDGLYLGILYGYGIVNIIAYQILKLSSKYYMAIVWVVISGSLVTFYMMTLFVVEDEFRLVWFFLTTFASFILGGRRYGFVVTMIIIGLVIYLYDHYDLRLSSYALFTFICSLVVLNTFAYAFLQKIESDERLLYQRVQEEVAKQHRQEQFLLRQYRMASMGEIDDRCYRSPVETATSTEQYDTLQYPRGAR